MQSNISIIWLLKSNSDKYFKYLAWAVAAQDKVLDVVCNFVLAEGKLRK